MNLYLLTQNDNTGYDTYDSAVVAAKDETQARSIHPGRSGERARVDLERDLWEEYSWTIDGEEVSTEKSWQPMDKYSGWTQNPSKVKVKLIGTAKPRTKAGVICASFNAG